MALTSITEEKGRATMAFAAMNKIITLSGARPMYNHCHKPGHEIDACFQLHGYPEW